MTLAVPAQGASKLGPAAPPDLDQVEAPTAHGVEEDDRELVETPRDLGAPGLPLGPADHVTSTGPQSIFDPDHEPRIEISVVHGSLEYAHYPVMVGHCEGATLKGAEAFVDDRLQGLLSKRQMIGQYPQQPGEAVFRPAPTAAAGLRRTDERGPDVPARVRTCWGSARRAS